MLTRDYPPVDEAYEIHIPENFEGPKTLEKLGIGLNFLVTVIAIGNAATTLKNLSPKKSDTIAPDDDIVVLRRTHKHHEAC